MKEHTFNTVNGTQNYALPTDFDRFVSGTAYNRTDLDAMAGPITPQTYQSDRFGTVTGGIVQRFRLKSASNALRFDITPTPTAAAEPAIRAQCRRVRFKFPGSGSCGRWPEL